MDKVGKNWLFTVSSNAKMKDHQMKLVGAKLRRNQRKFGFFMQQAVDV